jgi:hypothetical protein
VPLEVCGKIKKVKGRKVVVSATVSAAGEICAKGEVAAVKMPAIFGTMNDQPLPSLLRRG